MIPDSSTRTGLNEGSHTEVLINYWNKLSCDATTSYITVKTRILDVVHLYICMHICHHIQIHIFLNDFHF